MRSKLNTKRRNEGKIMKRHFGLAIAAVLLLAVMVAPVAAAPWECGYPGAPACTDGKVCEDHQCVYSCGPHDDGSCPSGQDCQQGTCGHTCNHNQGCYSNGGDCHSSCPIAKGECYAWNYNCVVDCSQLTYECGDELGDCVSSCQPSGCNQECQNVCEANCQYCVPSTEICNGVDDDCDDLVDEDLGTTTCGLGVCTHTIDNCVGGQTQVCDSMQGSSDETCNGLDDDCDGVVDDGNPGGDIACDTGLYGVCADGTTECSAGAIVCNQDVQSSDEVCDGLDNDCNNVVDDGGNALCEDQNDCTNNVCAGEDGCQFPNLPVLTDCGDDGVCDGQGHCLDCLFDEECEDDQYCQTTGEILGCIDLECDDGNVCNGAETASDHECVQGTPLNCDDEDDCTDDSCDAKLGCQHELSDECDCLTDEDCDEHQLCILNECVTQPYCGDDECNGEETAETCAQDCDPCYDVQCAENSHCEEGVCVCDDGYHVGTTEGHWEYGECHTCGGFGDSCFQPHRVPCEGQEHYCRWESYTEKVCEWHRGHKECHDVTKWRLVCTHRAATFVPGEEGCVADVCGDGRCDASESFETCPADCVQCETNADCENGLCVESACVPCTENSHVEENSCVCDEGYREAESECIEIPANTYSPYTEPECRDLLEHSKTQLTGVDVTKLPMLTNIKNADIRATVTYASSYDCAALTCYQGEASFNSDCSDVDYWSFEQSSDVQYGGGMLNLRVPTPVTACQLLVVKNSPETSLPVTIKITDSHGTVGKEFTTYDQVTKYQFALPDDYQACRPRVGVLGAINYGPVTPTPKA